MCDLTTVVPCGTALYVKMNDADLDGIVDPYPGEPQASLGLLDIFPRVLLEYVGTPLGSFEYEGKTYKERWLNEAYPHGGRDLAAAGQAGVAPGEAAACSGPWGRRSANELSVTFSPAFKHYTADGVAGVDVGGPYDIAAPRRPDGRPHRRVGRHAPSRSPGRPGKVPNEIAKFAPRSTPSSTRSGRASRSRSSRSRRSGRPSGRARATRS
ncbi:MAG: hypothetical protein R3F59_27970 [Myxococcota bacterium]